jgi:hypothetical protein
MSPEEKDLLIVKLKAGSIQKDEAQRLAAELEEDKKAAESRDDKGMAVAVGMILGALGYYLYKELDGKK